MSWCPEIGEYLKLSFTPAERRFFKGAFKLDPDRTIDILCDGLVKANNERLKSEKARLEAEQRLEKIEVAARRLVGA